jgi:hypothetical protein
MKIRRSILIFGLAIIAMIVLLIWFNMRPAIVPVKIDAVPSTTESTAAQTNPHAVASPARTNVQTITQIAPLPDVSSPPPTKTKLEQMRELIPLVNVPILFFGKLEDQFGNPVAGAEITGNVTVYNGFAGTHEKVLATSDANGFFKLDGGRGQMLGVMPRKPGYALASLNAGGNYSEDSEKQHPDPNNPVVVKMWKFEGPEPLLKINQRHKFDYKDAPINFDLLTGQTVQNGGDIRIIVERVQGILSSRNRQDWSIKIEATDGGIMDAAGQEVVTYWAPETGYEPYVLLTFSTNAPYKWAEGFTKGFFVESRKGQIYSKLGISFGINRNPDDAMDITFSGVANTNGSRNWEGDPNTYKP